ncbi:protein Wnt-10b isoform X2 [Octopus bimaculoides]|nr:protein Wnt-10b isoform X2 [Octopus bimaculoides]
MNYPYLSTAQLELCKLYPDVTASAIQGIQVAVHECQYQLKTYRWNCSTLETKNKNPEFSPVFKRGYRETAFAHAISAAGVTHQVSTACSLGKLRSCGCDMTSHGPAISWEWGGCSHNIEFGDHFARKFLDAKDTAKDIQAQINLHNHRAGRLAVINNVGRTCKCHGMSGSCEMKTCWKSTADFREVGTVLKEKFKAARKVILHNTVANSLVTRDRHRRRRRRRPKKPVSTTTAMLQKHSRMETLKIDLKTKHNRQAQKGRKKRKRKRLRGRYPRKTDLVYYEKSPSFCDPDPEIDSLGTTGRFCNRTGSDVDNCDTLCCGRGYNTLRVRRTERCNCKFYWCCYVLCDECVFDEWVTVCK